jgi:hypothetical protein
VNAGNIVCTQAVLMNSARIRKNSPKTLLAFAQSFIDTQVVENVERTVFRTYSRISPAVK